MTWRVLDLFCGAGGAAMGLHCAWPDAEITGVDNRLQPHYPFHFVLADAMTFPLDGYDFIWASPPCQEYSPTRHLRNANADKLGYKLNIRPKLINSVREKLQENGKPYVIENVPQSTMPSAIYLCGSMFGLPIRRHRWFEASQMLFIRGACRHTDGFYNVIGAKVRGYGDYASKTRVYRDCKGSYRRGEGFPGKAIGCEAMGIDWMTVAEMSEAIPPAYATFIAKQIRTTT